MMLRLARHFTAWLFVLMLFTAGCTTLPRPKERITCFFNWNAPGNELQARRYAEAGVTDVLVRNKRQYELAKKYGMTPYWKCFTPAGGKTLMICCGHTVIEDGYFEVFKKYCGKK